MNFNFNFDEFHEHLGKISTTQLIKEFESISEVILCDNLSDNPLLDIIMQVEELIKCEIVERFIENTLKSVT